MILRYRSSKWVYFTAALRYITLKPRSPRKMFWRAIDTVRLSQWWLDLTRPFRH